jgi:molybdopterin molybdotransferase
VGSRPNPPPLTALTKLEASEAARLIVAHVQPLPAVPRPLREALDLVCAETVISPIDLPPWDNSAMDGFACRSADARPGAVLRVIETVAAGELPARTLRAGEAARVFTGAPIPAGADGVIRQEDTEAGAAVVTIRDARDAGKNIRKKGEDIRAGQTVFAAGTELGPAHLGVLASIAHEPVAVHRSPVVAFVASGDEIVDLDRRDDILAGRRIATSNSYTLHAMIERAGAVPRDLGLVPDRADALRAAFTRAAEGGADLLLTTAGVSVGEKDLVRAVVEEMGGELKLWRVRIRPGGPLGFGMLGTLPWIGLPGNPVSTMVTFELFVRPSIRRLLGHALPYRKPMVVTVEERITLGPRLRHYLRVAIRRRPGGVLGAWLTGPQGSGILTSMTRADALLIVPEDRPEVSAGEQLPALFLDFPRHTEEPEY